jgi:hypothetical protein
MAEHDPSPRQRFYFDTEFAEDGRTIDLISIGVVCEDGREFYAVSTEFDADACNDWVQAHVLPLLPHPTDPAWMSRADIRTALLTFVGACKPEFWAYYADYDWVALCQLFGTMLDLPNGWPMYCRDIKQVCDDLGNPPLPAQIDGEHNALADAQWNVEAHAFLTRQNDGAHG